jgi:hypothetical protein
VAASWTKMVDDRARRFLLRWVLQNVTRTTYGDVTGAISLAIQCLIEAAENEIDPEAIVSAADGDLRGYIVRHLDRIADYEVML